MEKYWMSNGGGDKPPCTEGDPKPVDPPEEDSQEEEQSTPATKPQ